MDEETDWVKALHTAAMNAVDRALLARQDGIPLFSRLLLLTALDFETAAAQEATDALDRAVLYRSAAALALEASWPERARELALRGLAGSPPDAIADELRAVLSRC